MNLNEEKNVEAFTLDSEDNKDGKDFDKSIVHLENAGAANSQQWDQLRLDAMAAEELEHSMGLKQALRVYPKAAFWSFSISLCIVMEGYDIGLPNYKTSAW